MQFYMNDQAARRVKRECIEGRTLDIPQQWDPIPGKWITQYTQALTKPLYTPRGERIMLTCEDACRYADLQPDACRDCGSCRHSRQAPDSQLGVCGHPAHRRKGIPEEETV